MKTALIFPGQGSQFVGMGKDFYENYSISRDVFRNLDDVLGTKMSKLIFNGDPETLSQTQNSQPSIMATSIAIYQALLHENLLSSDSFDCVAGHSLGEYSALVVNQSLEFESSVKLLKVRSKAMQESMPIGTGAMIAIIGCSKEIIEQVIIDVKQYGEVFIANDNADGQVVLSGESNAIKYIASNSKSLNVKRAIVLPVSAPFHCKLIKNASDVLSSEINKYEFQPFSVPFYSNVTSKICDEKSIKKLLIEQVVSKVRWREIVHNMLEDGIKNFIEIGPGNVLSNLVRRASKNVNVISISKLEDLDKLDKVPV
ncbi:MAG: [acyl-carrier-protein] S-malonyltransferase [Flavobacteriales bacterium]|nr:[acyl-carrier-protein] S-malonyltransferase [Flavobacteriales bacterium]|tara:strand:- start:1838 stop:2776 length:939 start_codon:yes stop_codon:yes gene_type:complete